MALTVATGTLNARILGPAGRGELAAIQTIPLVLATLALLGLPSAVGYFSARRPNEARAFTLTGAGLGLIASVPAVIVGYLLMPWALLSQPPTVIQAARFYLIFIGLQAILTSPYVALQGLGKFGVWNLLRMGPNLAALGAIGLSFHGGSPSAERLSTRFLMLYSLLIPLAYAALWSRSRPSSANQSSSDRAHELLRYGLPSALMVPAGLLNLQLDQMMMAARLPSQVLGLYVVGVAWAGLISPAFGALGSIVFPTLAAARDLELQRTVVGRSLRLAVIVVVVLGVGLVTVTPVLFPLFFGKSYRPAVPAILILVAASMVLSLNNLCGEILRGLGVPRWPLYSQLAALPVTVVLLVVLLPRWGMVGAAVASLLACSVAAWVCIAGIRRTCRLSAKDLLFPTRAEYQTILTAVRGILVRLKGGTV